MTAHTGVALEYTASEVNVMVKVPPLHSPLKLYSDGGSSSHYGSAKDASNCIGQISLYSMNYEKNDPHAPAKILAQDDNTHT